MPDTPYRTGTHSPVNVWLGDEQQAMARTPHKADRLVQLANAGLALAEADPLAIFPVSGTDRTTSVCTLCGAIEGAGDLHLAECPWRAAREALGLDAGWPVAADGPKSADTPDRPFGVPRWAMFTLWTALGGDSDAFDRMWDEPQRTPPDTWAQLMAVTRGVDARYVVDGNPPFGPEFEGLLDARSAQAAAAGQESE